MKTELEKFNHTISVLVEIHGVDIETTEVARKLFVKS